MSQTAFSTCLTIAAELGDPATMQSLLDLYLSINGRGFNGRTPLMCACVSYGNTENIQFLIDKGANLYARDFDDVSALKLALTFGDQEMVDFLVDRGLSPTPSPISSIESYAEDESLGESGSEIVSEVDSEVYGEVDDEVDAEVDSEDSHSKFYRELQLKQAPDSVETELVDTSENKSLKSENQSTKSDKSEKITKNKKSRRKSSFRKPSIKFAEISAKNEAEYELESLPELEGLPELHVEEPEVSERFSIESNFKKPAQPEPNCLKPEENYPHKIISPESSNSSLKSPLETKNQTEKNPPARKPLPVTLQDIYNSSWFTGQLMKPVVPKHLSKIDSESETKSETESETRKSKHVKKQRIRVESLQSMASELSLPSTVSQASREYLPSGPTSFNSFSEMSLPSTAASREFLPSEVTSLNSWEDFSLPSTRASFDYLPSETDSEVVWQTSSSDSSDAFSVFWARVSESSELSDDELILDSILEFSIQESSVQSIIDSDEFSEFISSLPSSPVPSDENSNGESIKTRRKAPSWFSLGKSVKTIAKSPNVQKILRLSGSSEGHLAEAVRLSSSSSSVEVVNYFIAKFLNHSLDKMFGHLKFQNSIEYKK